MGIWISLAVVMTVAVVGWVYAWLNRRQLLLLQARVDQQLAALRQELGTVNSGAIGVGQRLISVEKKLNRAIDAQQQLTPRDDMDNQPFNYASSMAVKGADVQQLVERCGVSEAEAQLMTLVKKQGVR